MESSVNALDEDYVSFVLSNPPFVTIEGVHNVRDLGGYASTSYTGMKTKPLFMFRSAELGSLTPKGESQLKELGIRTVFDLRSDTEMEKYNSPLPTIEGVEVVRAPVFQKEDYSPETMAKRFALYSSGKTEAFMELYMQILDNADPSYTLILRHVRDHPDKGLLFHCTAGKDRTGLLAAIILKLAGVSDEDIAKDYALTRIGREPARAMVMQRLAKEPIFQTNNQAALNMFTCRSDTMHAFLKLLEEKYGGPREYLKKYLHFTEDDVERIRLNILVPKTVHPWS